MPPHPPSPEAMRELLLLCFFFTLVTGPGKFLSLAVSDTRVYAPQIRARLGTTAQFCECELQIVGTVGVLSGLGCRDPDPALSLCQPPCPASFCTHLAETVYFAQTVGALVAGAYATCLHIKHFTFDAGATQGPSWEYFNVNF